MFNLSQSDSFIRNTLISAACVFALSACSGDQATSAVATSGGSDFEVAGDHAIGNPDADVVVVEYASVVCGACANWHNSVYPDFKAKYIDTGKVRFIFREFPTSPANLAQAGFLIANCANEDRFMENISLQFKRQRALLTAQDTRQAYIDLAKASGLSEAEFEACLKNEDEIEKYEAVVKGGEDAGVTSTPTFFINGKKTKVFTIESFDEALAPLLGDDAPAPATEEPADATE